MGNGKRPRFIADGRLVRARVLHHATNGGLGTCWCPTAPAQASGSSFPTPPPRSRSGVLLLRSRIRSSGPDPPRLRAVPPETGSTSSICRRPCRSIVIALFPPDPRFLAICGAARWSLAEDLFTIASAPSSGSNTACNHRHLQAAASFAVEQTIRRLHVGRAEQGAPLRVPIGDRLYEGLNNPGSSTHRGICAVSRTFATASLSTRRPPSFWYHAVEFVVGPITYTGTVDEPPTRRHGFWRAVCACPILARGYSGRILAGISGTIRTRAPGVRSQTPGEHAAAQLHDAFAPRWHIARGEPARL